MTDRPNRTYHPRGLLVDGYQVWANMLDRCTNPKNKSYPNYGGRGIAVCPRWYHFRNFAEDMGIRPDRVLTIERVDNSKGYDPSNCRWDTRSNQCVNRRMFSNNTSGTTGVVCVDDGFDARFDYEKERYHLGIFSTFEAAKSARDNFVDLFFKDRDAAVASALVERPWSSLTNIKGVTPHADGGYIVRCTVNGVRHYLGYFQDIQEAADARTRFLAQRTR